MHENHCKDCCCALSWKALGITSYTGRSIPEEIARLKQEIDVLRNFGNKDCTAMADDRLAELRSE